MKRVLFVCTGNTCRSPMAEAIAREKLPAELEGEVEFTSAGTIAWDDQPASRLAAEVLREIGVDVSNHRAKRLTKELVDRADTIVAMSGEHREAVLALNPDLASRILILGELDPGRISPDIFDPIGGDREVYTKSREEILALVERLIQYLIEKYRLKE